MRYAIAAYVIGFVLSAIQLLKFHSSESRHRHVLRMAYMACLFALVIPVANIVGGVCLWWHLRQARRHRERWVNVQVLVPEHFRNKDAEPLSKACDES